MDAKKFLELYERGTTGKQISKNEWDMEYIVENVMDMVDKYDLSWDKQVIIPQDDDLLDRLFRASRELILQNGIYNMTTGRIMTLTEEEVDEGIMNAMAASQGQPAPEAGPEPEAEVPEREYHQETVRRDRPKIGRNDPCPCGSGKKYKNCCMQKDLERERMNQNA